MKREAISIPQSGTDRGHGPETSTPAASATTPTAALTIEQFLQRLAERMEMGPQPAPLLIDGKELARLLGVSPGTIERMKAAGELPAHVVLSGNCHRWNREEIRRWVEAGCPPQKEWRARQGAGDRGRTARAPA